MNPTWQGDPPPAGLSFGPREILSIVLRGLPLAVLICGGLALLLLLRLVERPLFGVARPITPYITVAVCRSALKVLGIRLIVSGHPLKGQGAVVANHASWLDIFVLNASKRIYFVSKAEVARWPGIGWLARATGTVFIERDRKRAAEHTELFRTRLAAGHKLLFFPEGTSSDGLRVLPFKTTLFAAFLDPALRSNLSIQPASLHYSAPSGSDPRFFGWWGEMDFGHHLLNVLAGGAGGRVAVTYHTPLKAADFSDRKSLARACEQAVRAGYLASGQGGSVK